MKATKKPTTKQRMAAILKEVRATPEAKAFEKRYYGLKIQLIAAIDMQGSFLPLIRVGKSK